MTEAAPSAAARLEAAAAAAGDQHYRLQLFIAGPSPRSQRAVANISRICDSFLAGRHQLEVVDIYQQTEKAKGADIIAAPTLIKSEPLPVQRLLGDLSDEAQVLRALGLGPERR